jgi:molecular chaperone DnaK (HSP70)
MFSKEFYENTREKFERAISRVENLLSAEEDPEKIEDLKRLLETNKSLLAKIDYKLSLVSMED